MLFQDFTVLAVQTLMKIIFDVFLNIMLKNRTLYITIIQIETIISLIFILKTVINSQWRRVH